MNIVCRSLVSVVAALAVVVLSAPATAVNITSENESQPFPGVTVVEGTTSSPNTEFYAAFIELCHDYVHVDASASNTTETSGQWASSQGAQVAVNGDFFAWGDSGMFVYGDAVGGGSQWPLEHTGLDPSRSGDWYYERHGWIAFGEDFVEYSNTEWIKNNWDDFDADQGWSPKTVTHSIPEGTQALVSGFPQLVVEGQPIQCSSPTASSCFPDRSDMRDRHPRTAMGLTEDRNTFILLVVDGRSVSSQGMYGAELADLMGQLGAHTAYNLDGGGSSQMWVEGQGTINTPSGGSPRSVPNSWGVFAGSSGGMSRVPGSCDRTFDHLLYQSHTRDHGGHTDVDGAGVADICARGPDGMECYLADGDGGFSQLVEGPNLSDDSGWGDPTNHSTIRMGDVTGDGRADVCARRNADFSCWPNEGGGFGSRIAGPDWSNGAGFDDIRYFSTIRLADVTGDGTVEPCARTPDGFRCYPYDDDGFGDPIEGPSFADGNGWGVPWHYGTIRMGDVTGNGKADVCARRAAGFACWPSDGDGFGGRIDGPQWSNAQGWDQVQYWSTIELVDLDGDGTADVCARGPDGIVCHLSTGDGFGDEIAGPSLADNSGWDDYTNYSTLRFGDITGDGVADLCIRANAGIRCYPWDGDGFGGRVDTGLMADDTGWFRERFFRTIRLADVTGDGRDDLCARASMGVVCWPADADEYGFVDDLELGPEWSDDDGWNDPNYYTTIRMATPCPGDVCEEEDDDGDNGGEPDAGGTPDAGAPIPDAGGPDEPTGDGDGETGMDDNPEVGQGCGCATTGGGGGGLWLVVLATMVVAAQSSSPAGQAGRGRGEGERSRRV